VLATDKGNPAERRGAQNHRSTGSVSVYAA